MNEVGRDLRRSPGPIPLLKQGQLEQAIKDCVPLGFESLGLETPQPLSAACASVQTSSQFLLGVFFVL